jgi:hypothetical protein
VPTDDYLYFELPRYHAVYAGCMFMQWQGAPVLGRELVTAREDDLYKLLTTGREPPAQLLRVDREPGHELIAFAGLAHTVAYGVRSRELAERYRGLSADELRSQRARLLADAVRDGIPASILNDVVYAALRAHELDRAFELALLQVLLAPASANAWDTLGEVCYFRGDRALALTYQRQARKLDPKAEGGEAVWQQDLAQLGGDAPDAPSVR